MERDKKYWQLVVSKILKAELAKRNIGYIQLVQNLNAMGVNIKVEDLRARISRGNFSATLLIQCLKAIQLKNLPLEESIFEHVD
jgi:Domain of unknown function (DUF6471)